ncbi:hypothetical protein R6Q59_035068 [Mikania micrantha]
MFSGDPKEKRYFFHKPSYNNHASTLVTYWKPVTINGNTHKLILATGCNHPIGYRKFFVFCQFSGHNRPVSKTTRILHQFSLLYPIQEWTVCSIHMKFKKIQYHGPTKRLKNYFSKYDDRIHQKEECISPLGNDDYDSASGITSIGDLDDREDEHEEDSRVN